MNKLLFARFPVTVFCGFALWSFCSSAIYAQGNPFSKYYRDQKIRSVRVGRTEIPGSKQAGKVYLTQEDVITMALRQNLDVNVERHNYLFDSWTLERQKGVYDPATTFGFNWDRAKTPTASVLAGGDSITNIVTSYASSYRQNFSTGTSLELNFSGIRNRSTSFFSSLVPAINTSFEFLFRQNLLEGFGRIGPDYEIEISRNNLDISEQEFKRRAHEIILQVLDRYWDLQFALQDIKVKDKSLQLAATVLEHNKARYEVGTAARLEVIQAEAEAASRREELIRSQFGYRRIQDQLVKLITNYQDPREFPGEIASSTQVYTPQQVSESFDTLQAMALEMHPEIQQADLDILNQKINLDLSRNRLRPTLDLVAGYQQFGLGGRRVVLDFSRGFTNAQIVDVIPGGLEDSFAQLFNADFYGYVVGVNLELPIFNTEARAENAQAQIALERAQLRQESVKQAISLEIRDALTQIEMNQARLQAAEAAVRFGRERLEGEEVRFDVGMGTTRELIEAQRDLLEAESVLLRAQIDLIKNHNLLDQILGRTFDRYNIRLADALQTNVR
ncbi:TolC family protein [Acidobacteria bacterium AH-259-O06]|nr:TolC family protein [Acidobacteria bacterium AH-259-O06]